MNPVIFLIVSASAQAITTNVSFCREADVIFKRKENGVSYDLSGFAPYIHDGTAMNCAQVCAKNVECFGFTFTNDGCFLKNEIWSNSGKPKFPTSRKGVVSWTKNCSSSNSGSGSGSDGLSGIWVHTGENGEKINEYEMKNEGGVFSISDQILEITGTTITRVDNYEKGLVGEIKKDGKQILWTSSTGVKQTWNKKITSTKKTNTPKTHITECETDKECKKDDGFSCDMHTLTCKRDGTVRENGICEESAQETHKRCEPKLSCIKKKGNTLDACTDADTDCTCVDYAKELELKLDAKHRDNLDAFKLLVEQNRKKTEDRLSARFRKMDEYVKKGVNTNAHFLQLRTSDDDEDVKKVLRALDPEAIDKANNQTQTRSLQQLEETTQKLERATREIVNFHVDGGADSAGAEFVYEVAGKVSDLLSHTSSVLNDDVGGVFGNLSDTLGALSPLLKLATLEEYKGQEKTARQLGLLLEAKVNVLSKLPFLPKPVGFLLSFGNELMAGTNGHLLDPEFDPSVRNILTVAGPLVVDALIETLGNGHLKDLRNMAKIGLKVIDQKRLTAITVEDVLSIGLAITRTASLIFPPAGLLAFGIEVVRDLGILDNEENNKALDVILGSIEKAISSILPAAQIAEVVKREFTKIGKVVDVFVNGAVGFVCIFIGCQQKQQGQRAQGYGQGYQHPQAVDTINGCATIGVDSPGNDICPRIQGKSGRNCGFFGIGGDFSIKHLPNWQACQTQCHYHAKDGCQYFQFRPVGQGGQTECWLKTKYRNPPQKSYPSENDISGPYSCKGRILLSEEETSGDVSAYKQKLRGVV